MSDVSPGLFCSWADNSDHWKCERCNAIVPKSVSATRPFAGCKQGMKDLGVTPTDLVLAQPRFNIPKDGPGTELKEMLSWLGIKAAPTCACNQRAAQMNIWGADVCEQRTDEIVGWLREEATKRKLPFLDTAGRMLVRRAIANARRKEQARAQEASQAEGPAPAVWASAVHGHRPRGRRGRSGLHDPR